MLVLQNYENAGFMKVLSHYFLFVYILIPTEEWLSRTTTGITNGRLWYANQNTGILYIVCVFKVEL